MSSKKPHGIYVTCFGPPGRLPRHTEYHTNLSLVVRGIRDYFCEGSLAEIRWNLAPKIGGCFYWGNEVADVTYMPLGMAEDLGIVLIHDDGSWSYAEG